MDFVCFRRRPVPWWTKLVMLLNLQRNQCKGYSNTLLQSNFYVFFLREFILTSTVACAQEYNDISLPIHDKAWILFVSGEDQSYHDGQSW